MRVRGVVGAGLGGREVPRGVAAVWRRWRTRRAAAGGDDSPALPQPPPTCLPASLAGAHVLRSVARRRCAAGAASSFVRRAGPVRHAGRRGSLGTARRGHLGQWDPLHGMPRWVRERDTNAPLVGPPTLCMALKASTCRDAADFPNRRDAAGSTES